MADRAPLASRQEVAEYLQVSPLTLTRWAHLGTGPKFTRVGKYARYSWTDVKRWLDRQEHGGGT